MNIKNWLFLLSTLFLFSYQSPENGYPKGYFRAPVGGEIRLAGSCGELRSNHFHMGIDIKPQNRAIAEPIYAAAEGFVKRIVVSPRGYGNGIYIEHPNGYTTVYGHLKEFNHKITEYIQQLQYQNKSFALDLDNLSPDLFPLQKGETIGKMGNAGSSAGPHLHFEIRKTSTGHALNPLLFGLTVADNLPPKLNAIKVYSLNHKLETTSAKTYNLTANKAAGSYSLSPSTVTVHAGRVGLGIKTFDFMNDVPNWNGAYAIKMYQDGALKYHFEAEEFSLEEWYYLNAHVDYKDFKKNSSYINRCYLLPGNGNSTVYKTAINRGVLDLQTGKPSHIKFEVSDITGNISTLEFDLLKDDKAEIVDFSTFNYILPYAERSVIRMSELELEFPEGSFYEDVYLTYRYAAETSDHILSGVHHIHEKYTPVHLPFKIKIRPVKLPEALKNKVVIAQCNGTASETGYTSTWEGDFLTAESRTFGSYCIMLDTLPPVIRATSFKADMSRQERFSFKITDNLAGIQSYNAWVDGQWILMEYDLKSDGLTHWFDGRIARGEHRLKLVVVDKKGNEAVFEEPFSY